VTRDTKGTKIKERNQAAPESQKAGPSSGPSKISTRVELRLTRDK
ncbi:8690_t:CDS:2, partial [Paraglomus brasilianum]